MTPGVSSGLQEETLRGLNRHLRSNSQTVTEYSTTFPSNGRTLLGELGPSSAIAALTNTYTHSRDIRPGVMMVCHVSGLGVERHLPMNRSTNAKRYFRAEAMRCDGPSCIPRCGCTLPTSNRHNSDLTLSISTAHEPS
jgi:hypothetical protein